MIKHIQMVLSKLQQQLCDTGIKLKTTFTLEKNLKRHNTKQISPLVKIKFTGSVRHLSFQIVTKKYSAIFCSCDCVGQEDNRNNVLIKRKEG